MKLVAVYFPKESQFKDITINLGGRYNYNVELNQRNIYIKRDVNEKYIENFYLNEITSINAIAGRNGVGKTSFFKAILNFNNLVFIFENINNHENSDWFLSLSEHHNNILIGVKNFINEDDNIQIPLKKIREKNHYGYSIFNNKVDTPTFYYYSPLSNFSLSTKYIDSFIVNSDSIIEIKSETLQRQVLFLMQKDLIKELTFVYDGFPRYESIKINNHDVFKFDYSILDYRFYSFYKNNTFKKDKGLNELQEDEQIKNAYELDIKSKLYNNVFLILSKKITKQSGRQKIYFQIYLRLLIFLFSISNFRTLDIVTNFISKKLNRRVNYDDVSFENLVTDTIDTIVNISEKKHEGYIVDDLKSIKILINEILLYLPDDLEFRNLDLQLNSLYESYFKFIQVIENGARDFVSDFEIPFLKFETDINLSQGEEYLLNLFANIFSNKELGSKKNIILLLDEPDLGFHPKWKKKLVNSLHKILPPLINSISPKDLDIDSFDNSELTHINSLQVIFTTHDPLTLSDLPNDKVIYLNKKENQYYLDNKNNLKKSFGANITDLLADSFYIDDGLIGDFAKTKIQDLIEYINHEDKRIEKLWIKSPDIAKKVIDQIGEPYLSEKLNDMFLDAFPEFKNGEILKLEEKLKQLKNGTTSDK